MFESGVYAQRRADLRRRLDSGIIMFYGNSESPMNYRDNPFPFRQDSSFLYYLGIDTPDLAAIIDLDEGTEMLLGDDLTVDQIVWMGPHPTVEQLAEKTAISTVAPLSHLSNILTDALAKGRKIHLLPPYRSDNKFKIAGFMDIAPNRVCDFISESLIKAIVAQRSTKSDLEVREIETALGLTHDLHVMAMQETKSGLYERDIVGRMEGLAYSRAGCRLAYPAIFSVHGETLHNHFHGNRMQDGDVVLNDSGAESPLHYASDITRTFPVSGKFTQRQRELYQIVLRAEERAIEMLAPGVSFRDIHLASGLWLMEGLAELGLVKGDLEQAVQDGAHALFFQCGLGHMMGLDTHDMEDLGEQHVGYDSSTIRSDQFGLCYLRLAKPLEEGFVVTVEPGLYFIPELIDMWQAEKKFQQYLNYDQVNSYRDAGGYRVEDNLIITGSSYRLLGKPIPKQLDEVEALASG